MPTITPVVAPSQPVAVSRSSLRSHPKSPANAGSDAGGERAACIYSLIGTALLNDRDPYLYLRHVLERIAEHPIHRIGELLPWRVTLEIPAQRCA